MSTTDKILEVNDSFLHVLHVESFFFKQITKKNYLKKLLHVYDILVL